MATPILIQGTTYKKLAPLAGGVYDLVPFDGSGNLFGQVTIEVDTTGGEVDINLPEISTLNNNYNCKVIVIRTAGGNNCLVIGGGSDLIGQNTNVKLVNIGDSIELSPITSTSWYGVKTT